MPREKSAEQFNTENQEPRLEQKIESGNRPAVELPEILQWQTKMRKGEDGKAFTSDVKAPDGTNHRLKEGENFVITRGENGDYEAAIVNEDGEKMILRESLANKKDRLGQEDKDELEKLRESLGLEVEKTEVSAETKEMRELNEKLKPAAEYLERLDRYAEAIEVDPDTGKIKYEKPKLEDVKDEQVRKYKENFEQLLRDFKDRNKAYMEKLRNDPAILDVQEIAGAIVATYDSSKKLPSTEGAEHMNDSRGNLSTASEKYLGLALVDINKASRTDGVSVETSATHELNHYMLSVSDYLISKDENIDMQSAYRKGRPTALYGFGKDRIPSAQAVLNDRDKYSVVLGREFDPQNDPLRIERQLNYLDEVHSSFLQGKEDWFDAQGNVYALGRKGKHWELVGDHPDDIEATKNMLGYMQGFYTLDKIKEGWGKRDGLGEGQKKFLQEYDDEFRKIGSLIGTARTVKQAETLVAQEWKSFMEKNPKIASHPDFQAMMDGWEKGAGVENLRSILLGKN
jgi:hypothetical protein